VEKTLLTSIYISSNAMFACFHGLVGHCCEKGRGQRYGFININDMYNNDVGKGGAQGCEAYEVE
jgi:hypothetical protein